MYLCARVDVCGVFVCSRLYAAKITFFKENDKRNLPTRGPMSVFMFMQSLLKL